MPNSHRDLHIVKVLLIQSLNSLNIPHVWSICINSYVDLKPVVD